MELIKIALTGGPGGGKSEAAAALRREYRRKGVHVVSIRETATDLILSGLDGRTTLSNRDFQGAQLDLQLFKEDLYEKAARKSEANCILLVCDRGVLDGKAFIEPEIFEALLKERNLCDDALLARYDAIIHMSTAAKSKEAHYSLSNNPARLETPDEAAKEDDRLLEIYQNHPHRYVIEPCDTIEQKNEILFQLIDDILRKRTEKREPGCM